MSGLKMNMIEHANLFFELTFRTLVANCNYMYIVTD